MKRMPLKPNVPLFLTFEGGEGAGKTTLIARLQEHLQSLGLDVLSTREPGGSPLGNAIRDLVLGKREGMPVAGKAELLLFLAARASHVEEIIVPALNSGKIVLCDRFNDSTVAYQGIARGMGAEAVRSLCDYATGGLSPTQTFYLDLPPAIGFQRMNASSREHDRMEDEEIDFHLKVRQAFLAIAKEDPNRVKVLDASLPPEQVFQQLLSQIHLQVV